MASTYLFILAFCIANINFVSVVKAGNCKLDLVFVLDKSSSIENDQPVYGGKIGSFKEVILQFVKDVAKRYDVTPRGMHAAMVLFSQKSGGKDKAVMQFSFRFDRKDFEKQVNKIETDKGFGGTTRIDKGLEVARKELFEKSDNGFRNDAKKFVILITDGQQQKGYEKNLLKEAKEIGNLNIGIVALGIGRNVNKEQMEEVVKQGGENGKYSHVASFAALKDKLPFVENLCNEPCDIECEALPSYAFRKCNGMQCSKKG